MSKHGGPDLERVFLRPLTFVVDGHEVVVERSAFPGASSMDDVFMRHIGRYGFALPYIRPGYRVLDFPCGSGLALELLQVLGTFGGITYRGLDIDPIAVRYAAEVYHHLSWVRFDEGDLTKAAIEQGAFDTIMCIEGLEHIAAIDQEQLIPCLYRAIAPCGTLIVSSPAPVSGISGPNPHNRYHLYERTLTDLKGLLQRSFNEVEIVSQRNTMTTGEIATCYYAVCHKS